MHQQQQPKKSLASFQEAARGRGVAIGMDGDGGGGDVLEKKGGEELSGKFGPETDGERSGGVSPTCASTCTIHQTPPRGEEKGG